MRGLFLALVCSASVLANSYMAWDSKLMPMDVVWGEEAVDADPTLINGTVPDMKKFQASVWVGNCTATVVGPRALVYAAHCTNGRVAFSVGPSRYTGKCSTAREYSGNSTADYALCVLDQEVKGIEFETINTDPNYLSVGDKVLLSGFGCTRPGGRGGIDGQYWVGPASVTRLPSGSNNDIVTKNGAALCFGDSGGPAWKLLPGGERGKQISVNSRGDIATTSYLSSLSTDTFDRFLKSWMSSNPGVEVCGVTPSLRGCLGDKPEEPVMFDLVGAVAKLRVTILPGSPFTEEQAKRVLGVHLNVLGGVK